MAPAARTAAALATAVAAAGAVLPAPGLLLLRRRGTTAAAETLRPKPYVLWVNRDDLPSTTPPLPEQCYGCECLAAHPWGFIRDGRIAPNYTCGGGGGAAARLPELSWAGFAEGFGSGGGVRRASFAVTVDDLDYPNGIGAADNRLHNLFWAGNIPSDWTSLTEAKVYGAGDIPDSSVLIVGRNSLGRQAIEPVCPAKGEHRYKITLWALSSDLGAVGPDSSYKEVRAALGSRELARVTFFARARAPGWAHRAGEVPSPLPGDGTAPAPAPAPPGGSPAAGA